MHFAAFSCTVVTKQRLIIYKIIYKINCGAVALQELSLSLRPCRLILTNSQMATYFGIKCILMCKAINSQMEC